MRVPVGDRVAPREARDEPRLPPRARSTVVRHADPDRPDLDDALRREQCAERRLVGIPVHRVHRRPERAQLVEERDARKVARVQDYVGAAQLLHARLGEPPGSPRKMRVGDDRDPAQAPAVSVDLRSGFVSATSVTVACIARTFPLAGPLSFALSDVPGPASVNGCVIVRVTVSGRRLPLPFRDAVCVYLKTIWPDAVTFSPALTCR